MVDLTKTRKSLCSRWKQAEGIFLNNYEAVHLSDIY